MQQSSINDKLIEQLKNYLEENKDILKIDSIDIVIQNKEFIKHIRNYIRNQSKDETILRNEQKINQDLKDQKIKLNDEYNSLIKQLITVEEEALELIDESIKLIEDENKKKEEKENITENAIVNSVVEEKNNNNVL